MANQIKPTSITRDAVTGRTLGPITGTQITVREIIVGERLGRLAPGVYNSIVSETIGGDAIGAWIKADSIHREVIAGDSIGRNLLPQFASTYREVIGRESSYRFQTTVREIIGSMPGDFTALQRAVPSYRQEVAQRRVKLAPPAMWSMNTVGSVRMLTAQRGHLKRPSSTETVQSVRALVAFQAARPPPANVFSQLRVGVVRELVAKSKTIAYNPVSGAFVAGVREQVARKRTVPAAGAYRSTNLVLAERQLVALSKRTGYQLRVPQLFELVARQRILTFSAPTTDAGMTQIVAQKKAVKKPFSSEAVITERQQIAQRRITPGIIRSYITAFSERQQIAQRRVMTSVTRSTTTLYAQQQQIAQRRVPILYKSDAFVSGEVQLAAQKRGMLRYISEESVVMLRALAAQARTPKPMPYTGESVPTLRMLTAQHREVAPPDATSDWRVKTGRMLAALKVTRFNARSGVFFKTQRVSYALHRVTLPPKEVIGPEVGAQVKAYVTLSAQHRVTLPPDDLSRAVTVSTMWSTPLLRDVFPPATSASSDATITALRQVVLVADTFAPAGDTYTDEWAYMVAQQAAVTDVFPSAITASSEAVVQSVGQQVVAGDVFPDPLAPRGELMAQVVAQQVAATDVFTDPRGPSSEVVAYDVLAQAVVTDVFPDAVVAHSDVSAMSVVSSVAVTDKFADPLAAVSDVAALGVAQQPVVADVFGNPQAATSTVDALAVTMQAVITDLFDNPQIAGSDATVRAVSQVVALGDKFGDAQAPQSDAVITALASTVVVGDKFPDPVQSTAEAQVLQLATRPVVRDLFADPAQPTSDVEARLVGATPLIRDASFGDATGPTSDALAFSLAMFVVCRDDTLLRVPLRTDRRRAVLTVSIS